MTRIFLIGYMGVGKTTIGKALAARLQLPFYDLDTYIENRRRKKVAELFGELGEEGFRHIEHNMLHEVAEFEDVIVSCGGGTPCFFDNIDYMNRQGQVVWLNATTDVLVKHLKMARVERPLLKGKSEEELFDFIDRQLQARAPFYSKAHYSLDVTLLDSHKQISNTIDQLLELLPTSSPPQQD